MSGACGTGPPPRPTPPATPPYGNLGCDPVLCQFEATDLVTLHKMRFRVYSGCALSACE